MTSPTQILLQRLAASPAESQALGRCIFFLNGDGQICVECGWSDRQAVVLILVEHGRKITSHRIPVYIRESGQLFTTVEPCLIMQPPSFLVPEIPFTWQLPNPEVEACAIAMGTQACVWSSSQFNQASKCSSSWVGRDIRPWHIPEELERLNEAIATHKFIDNFQYRALNFENEPILLTVRGWLVHQNGVWLRVMQNLHREPL